MDPEFEVVEQRLKSFLCQLRTEYGILDRMVYKNKNQHRRCSYFQFLLKVRRDMRLLQLANLDEILTASVDVISGKRPKQKVQLLESLKRKRSDGGKFNFLERLLGVARLLSQMIEPMLKAATEISTLLARSFFMGFSLTILSLLARLRVLVQQMLLDVVCVFNSVSSVSRKGQAVKLNQEGFEVFREYYPIKEQVATLECIWHTDKFLLVEKTKEGETKDQRQDSSAGTLAIQYQSIEVFLGDGGSTEEPVRASREDLTNVDASVLPTGHVHESNDEKQPEDGSDSAGIPDDQRISTDGSLLLNLDSAPCPLRPKSGLKDKVAFVSIKLAPSVVQGSGSSVKVPEKGDESKEDPLFSLLTDANMKSSLF